MLGRALRVALGSLGALGVALGIVALRVVVEGEQELQVAEARLAAGDPDAGALHLVRAVRWYLPGSPYPPRALARLVALAAEADRAGDPRAALVRYRRVRSAILSVRSVVIPFEDTLALADARIADLMARTPPAPLDADRPFEARRELFARQLADAAHADPDPVWTIVLLAGFALWVLGAFGFAARAIDADDRLVPSQARSWGLAVLVGLAAWIAGMVLA